MRDKLKTIIKGVLISFLIVLVFEFGARLTKTVLDDVNLVKNRPFVHTPELGWELRPNFTGSIYGKSCEVDKDGFLVEDTPQINDDKRPKVVFIGDSWTFGNKTSVRSTFVEIVDDLLPEMNVINMGIPGYSSFQGYVTIQKRALDLNPSLIVVSFSLNDRRFVLREEDRDSLEKFEILYKVQSKQKIADYIYLFKGLNYLKEKMYPLEQIDLRTVYARVPPEAFYENLIKIAALSSEKNIPLVFLLFKDNPNAIENLLKGVMDLKNSDYDSAIANLKRADSLENYYQPLARKYLSEAYEKKGLMDEANDILTMKLPFQSIHGNQVLYFTEEYNVIMRRVAEEKNLAVADPTLILDENSFLDYTHLNEQGHKQVALLLFDIISRMFPSK
ncbi:GDSL-type esterase/lipase family protein [Acidobacteriota bacterium]